MLQAIEDFANIALHFLTDLRFATVARLARPVGIALAIAGIGMLGLAMFWPAAATFLLGLFLYAIGPRWLDAIIKDALWQMDQQHGPSMLHRPPEQFADADTDPEAAAYYEWWKAQNLPPATRSPPAP